MSDETDILGPYENTLSVDELRREVRRGWDEQAELVKALRDLPEVPSYRVLLMLSRAAKWPEDGNRGKRMQGSGVKGIPYKTEAEMGAGLWSLIRAGIQAGRADDSEHPPR